MIYSNKKLHDNEKDDDDCHNLGNFKFKICVMD